MKKQRVLKRLRAERMLVATSLITMPEAFSVLGKAIYGEDWAQSPAGALLPFHARWKNDVILLRRRELYVDGKGFRAKLKKLNTENIPQDELAAFHKKCRRVKTTIIDALTKGTAGLKATVSFRDGEKPWHITRDEVGILGQQSATVFDAGYVGRLFDNKLRYGLITMSRAKFMTLVRSQRFSPSGSKAMSGDEEARFDRFLARAKQEIDRLLLSNPRGILKASDILHYRKEIFDHTFMISETEVRKLFKRFDQYKDLFISNRKPLNVNRLAARDILKKIYPGSEPIQI